MVGCMFYIQTFAEVMKLPSDLLVQAWIGGLWFANVVFYCHCTLAHCAIVFHQTIAAIHALQNGAKMRMTFDE